MNLPKNKELELSSKELIMTFIIINPGTKNTKYDTSPTSKFCPNENPKIKIYNKDEIIGGQIT